MARVVARLSGTEKAQGAAEGQTIAQPIARVEHPDQGWLPMNWGINFWQRGYNVISTGENATVDACVWAYIRAIAQLPGFHRRTRPDNGVDTITTTALSRLLRFPNTYETRSDFLTHTVRSLLYEGNSYWLGLRNQRNEVVSLHWLNPKQCRSYVAETGDIFYSIGDNPVLNGDPDIDSAERWLVPQRNILHIKLATPRDPLVGETWLTSLAWDLLNRGAMNLSQSAFFQNMSRPSGVLSTEQILTTEQVDQLRTRWNEHAAGMAAGGVPILTAGLKFEAISLNAQDSQIIDQLKLSDRTIAGVFGVPGVLIGITEATGWNNTEALMNFWLANGLGYVLDHIETAMDQFFELPAPDYVEFDTDALLRTALKDRIEALARGVTGGIFAPNEARAREGLHAVEAGDEPRVQQQQVPLSFASLTSIPPAPGQPGVPGNTPGAPPALPAPAPSEDDEDEDDEDAARAMQYVRLHARERIAQKLAEVIGE
jgi:HK97 family phage portal protein